MNHNITLIMIQVSVSEILNIEIDWFYYTFKKTRMKTNSICYLIFGAIL